MFIFFIKLLPIQKLTLYFFKLPKWTQRWKTRNTSAILKSKNSAIKKKIEINMVMAWRHVNEKRFYFVVVVENQQGNAGVIVITMNKKSSLQELELSQSEIGRTSRIASLFAVNANAHMSLLDHGHVVGSVSDRRGHWLLFALFDQLYNLILLFNN